MTTIKNNKCLISAAMAALLILYLCFANLCIVNAATSESFVGTVPETGIEAPEGYQVTLVVDGVETEIVPGTSYTKEDNAVVVYTNAKGLYGSYNGRGEEEYRTALFVDNTGIVEEKSVTEAIAEGTYDETSADGLSLKSTSDNFSGFILNGNDDEELLEYTISNSEFAFLTNSDGSNISDFTAFGAVLIAFGNSKLTLDNVKINTEGVAKAAIVADTGADILVKDSEVNVAGGTLYDGYVNTADQTLMVAPPWVLGITGNARGTNLLGDYSTSTFVNSKLTANGWGVLSTDACSNVVLTTIDTTLTLDGDSGYGTYAIGNAKEYFYGTAFDVATYANIITGGYVTYASSNGTFDIVEDSEEATTIFEGIEGLGQSSTINSDAFGIMWHGNGEANVLDGTEVNTENAAFLIKNGIVGINVDNAVINSADGTILQMMDNDDNTVGVYFPEGAAGPSFNTEFHEEEGYPGIDNDVIYDPNAAAAEGAMSEGEAAEETMTVEGVPENTSDYTVTANFTNVSLDGNIYNATGYVGEPKTLSVIIGENAELNGIITASSAIHSTDSGETQNTDFTIDEYYKLGHVANKVYYNGDNNVDVAVESGGVWNVTEECEITSLTVEPGGTVNGTITVDGSEIEVAEGETYEGTILLSAGTTNQEETTPEATEAAETVQTEAADADGGMNTTTIIIIIVVAVAVIGVLVYMNSKKKNK